MDYSLSVVNLYKDSFKDLLNSLAGHYGCGPNNMSIKLVDNNGNVFWGCHSWWKPEDYTLFKEAPIPQGMEFLQEAKNNLIEFLGEEGEQPLDTWKRALLAHDLSHFIEEVRMYLNKGTKGDDVKLVQTTLSFLGYDVGTIDGIFGSKTEIAVKSIQKTLGLKDDGIVGNWLFSYLLKQKPKATITITAGHSNTDPGAVNGSRTEAKIVTELRNIVAEKLKNLGFNVLTDGVGDENQKLNLAVKLIPLASVAIELHLNAAANKTAGGVEALSQTKDKKISQKICQNVAEVLGIKTRGGDGGWKAENSGQHHRLAFVSGGGIILETFFISNDEELATYDRKKNEVAEAIVKAIVEHV